MVFHDFQGFGGEHFGAGGLAVSGHDLFDQGGVYIDVAIQAAAQVTVGEDPGQPPVGFKHHGHAQTFARHFKECVLEQGSALHLRQLFTGVHDVLDFQQQAAAEGATWVRESEVFSGKAACLEQGNGQGVAQDQCGGSRGGRCQVQWAGFLGNTGIEVDFGGLGQRRVRVAGQADQLDAQALDQRQQGNDLGGRTGVGQGEDDIVAGDHAHVAMAGFGRMNEEGRRAGAGQGRGDFVADMPGLAHADHHHAALAGQDQLARLDEIGVDVG
ncbi:hypothetical protein D3C78_1202770 [compost metagenome]